jgi:phage regulator Rha-like protein
MLDADLAALYEVSTKAFNQAVKRNRDRFPEYFAFLLTRQEVASLRSQFVTSNVGRGGRRYRPYAFTEHGVAMLSAVLRSRRAVQMSVAIIDAFIRLREIIASNKELAARMERLEAGQSQLNIAS